MVGLARRAGYWTPLSGQYFHDDRIAEAGPDAELLFVRGLAYCAQTLSDGFMSDQQVRRLVSVGLENVSDLCKRLVDVGLWDRDDDRQGYVVRQWLKWNRSREEIERYRGRDAARKRAGRSPDGLRAESDRSPDGIRGPEQSRAEQIKESDRTSGPVRSDSSPPAPPPDLTAVRERLGDATRAAKARQRKTGDDE